MAKKILAIVLALGMLVGTAAPAAAAYNIWIYNDNWIDYQFVYSGAYSWSGDEDVEDTGGNVDITNDDTEAITDVEVITNTNDTEVGDSSSVSYDVDVENYNGIDTSEIILESVSSTGDDEVYDTGGNVTLSNGSSSAYTGGFLLTNGNITRVY